MSGTDDTTYAVEVRNTDKVSGASRGWETFCPHHSTMLKAIACKERAIKAAQDQYNAADADHKKALERCRTETQIVKLTRETVEAVEEFIPAK